MSAAWPLGPVTVLGAHILDVLGRPVEEIPPGQGSVRLLQIRATAAGTAGGAGVDLAKLGGQGAGHRRARPDRRRPGPAGRSSPSTCCIPAARGTWSGWPASWARRTGFYRTGTSYSPSQGAMTSA